VHRVHEEMQRGRSSSDEPATHAGKGSNTAPFSPRRSACQPFHSPFTTRRAPAHLSFKTSYGTHGGPSILHLDLDSPYWTPFACMYLHRDRDTYTDHYSRPTRHERSSTAATARPTTFHLNFLETRRLGLTRLHGNLPITEGLRRIMTRGPLGVSSIGWDRVAYNHKNGYDDFPLRFARTHGQTRFSRRIGFTVCSTLRLRHPHYDL
jgi:hypothetical protein